MRTFLKKLVFVAGLIVLSSPFISCDNNYIKKEKDIITLAENVIPIHEEVNIEVIARKPVIFIVGFDKDNETFYSNARIYF